ncbi:MAG: hypothetical protein C5B57_12800 [Blastocatellia bacterium]|nr:MAG: hypothetical protein C5B57_12800 [Blastocatellia bacterium]
MTHYEDGDLILYYYGEGRGRAAIERHMQICDRCAEEYRSIVAVLQSVRTGNVPERGITYGTEVWQRISGRLPEPETRGWWTGLKVPALATAAVLLAAVAFLTGRLWPTTTRPVPLPASIQSGVSADPGARARLAVIADHLERSERVLLDFLNEQDQSIDLSDQQAWAADLVDSNRLYREAAAAAGDQVVANLLDELERHLLEIVHGPAKPTPAEIEDVRVRLSGAALLFKVRVLAEELGERETVSLPSQKGI